MLTKYVGPLFLFLITLLFVQCKQPSFSSFPLEHLQSLPIGTQPTTKKKTGKITAVPTLEDLYTKQASLSIPFPIVDGAFSMALQDHLRLLAHLDQPESLLDSLDAYQIHGKDQKGNVYFTGYFTPVIEVAEKPSAKYTYPIYTGQGILEGRGLELAYARRLVDIYYMQLQGSGIIEYPNGRQEYLSFTSTNGHSYRSIEKYIINNDDISLSDVSMNGIKRFVKQNPDLEKPILFTNVDSKYIPLGSCLLAAMPVVDNTGGFSHHEYKIVLAQDTGAFHHYGRLWLLLPKSK